MTSNIEKQQSEYALHLAKENFKKICQVPNNEWTTVNNNDKIYTHEVNQTKTIKVVRELNTSEKTLQHFYASLCTIRIRSTWNPLFDNFQVIDQPSENTNIIHAQMSTAFLQHTTERDIDLVEQTVKTKDHVDHISTAINKSYLLCIRISKTTATAYYQWDTLYSPSLISTLLDNMLNIKSFPWISHMDKAITIEKCVYGSLDNECELKYLYTGGKHHQNAMDIRTNSTLSTRSREQAETAPFKNSFLSSSSLFFSASSPKRMMSSSFPEKRLSLAMMEDEEMEENTQKDELRIQVDSIPQLDITLPRSNTIAGPNTFARLCVRCYRHSDDKTGYIIQILHPDKLIQQLSGEDVEETMKLDEDEDEKTIQVRLSIKNATSSQCLVNGDEWPILLWDNDNSSDEEEEEDIEQAEQEEIFVDGMENVADTSLAQSPPLMALANSLDIHPIPLKKQPKSDSVIPKADQVEKEVHSSVTSVADTQEKESVDEKMIMLDTTLPVNDPVALQKIYPQFAQFISLDEANPTIVQSPSKENGYVSIKQLHIPNHPMGGGFLSESTWKDCSIWDIKSVLESAGARKIWDNTFESNSFLHALTPTSSIWHTKWKGTWPVNPRDYVCFYGQYTSSPYHIDLISTSCIGDSFQYKPLPAPVPGYTRATMDIMGWRLEHVDAKTTLVKQVLVTQFPTWVINYVTSRFIVQSCAAVQFAKEYLNTFGAPPSLESLSSALLVNLKHDHDKKNWRCEYTRRTEADNNERKTTTHPPPSTNSVIRLDKRRWATGTSGNKYSIVIDPPPSLVSALEKVCDPYGIWLTVEHDEKFIIPLRGKILVLIKPDTATGDATECQLSVNGVSTRVEKELQAPIPKLIRKQSSFSSHFLKQDIETVAKVLSEEEKTHAALEGLIVTPKERAQAALSFLKQTDEQFGWTVISDNSKSGLRVSKKPGIKNINGVSKTAEQNTTSPAATPLAVYDPYMVYKATKVIENFSVEEVAAAVTDIGNVRKTYDDTLESVELVKEMDPGLRVIRQSIKAIFPFKNREIIAVSCLAQEMATSTSPQRTLYIESSIPHFPVINSKTTRGNVYMSGWILEAIDPYTTTTNHPIPSMRVTYVSALDLGVGVPSYISNLLANNWAAPKKIQSVESYLKSKGPPPFLTLPLRASIFTNSLLSIHNEQEGIRWLIIQTNYDKEKHHYKANSRMVLENKSQKPFAEDMSPSKSITLTSPIRRPSTHTLVSSDTIRRGSLPVNTLPKKRIVPITTTEPEIKEKSAVLTRSITFLQATLDLRVFSQGYEMTCQLYDVTDVNKKKNVSGKLVLSISEPSLSNMVDGKKKQIKHTVLVKADGLFTPLETIYEFEFSITPVREETLKNKPTQLTVSNVLGEEEDKDKWNGIIVVNGIEVTVGTDVALKSLVVEEVEIESLGALREQPVSPSFQTPELDFVDHHGHPSASEDEEDLDKTMQYMGGGVVAAALGNVSAGVNNLGARMMFPFRNRSTSLLIPTASSTNTYEPVIHDTSDDDNDEEGLNRFSKDRLNSSATLHEIRLLRRSRDTMRKGIFLVVICLSTAVIFALLMLQPLLERYYASFSASSTVASLDRSIENGIIQRLVQIPWFGGWDIQLIAIKRDPTI